MSRLVVARSAGGRAGGAAVVAAVAVLCLAALSCAALSFLPYGAVLAWLDALSSTGSAAGAYPPGTHARLVFVLRAGGLVLAGAAWLLFLHRDKAASGFDAFGADLAGARADVGRALRGWGGARNGEYLVLAVLTLGGAALRVAYMDVPAKGDETIVLLQFAERSVPVILADYSNVGNHVLHTLLMHLSWLLLGENLWGMRLPTLLAGVLMVPAAHFAARGLYGRAVALVAAALVAGSSALVEYSVNGRGYVLQSLLLLCLFGAAQLLLHRERASWWAAWVLLVGLALWTLPTSAIACVAISLWYLANLFARDGRAAWPGVTRFVLANLAAGLFTLALYSPILLTAGFGHMAYMLRSGSTDVAPDLTGALAALWGIWTRNMPGPTGALALGLLVWGVVREHRGAAARVPVGVVFALWLAAFYLVLRTVGYARLWLPFAAFVYILMAVGLVDASRVLGRVLGRVPPGGQGAWSRRAAWGAPLLVVAVLAADELWHGYVARPDGDSFVQAPALAAALPGVALPGERLLAMQPVGSTLHLHLRRLGVAHHHVPFRGDPARSASAVLAMGPPGSRPPGTLLAVVRQDGAALPQILGYFGVPAPGDPPGAVLSLPGVRVVRVQDPNAGQ